MFDDRKLVLAKNSAIFSTYDRHQQERIMMERVIAPQSTDKNSSIKSRLGSWLMLPTLTDVYLIL